jgi:CHAT domain-containing protein/Tfp pilus assembly protein PilF
MSKQRLCGWALLVAALALLGGARAQRPEQPARGVNASSKANQPLLALSSPVLHTVLKGHQANTAVYQAALSRDGKVLFSAGEDGQLARWDPVTHLMERVLPGHQGPLTSLALTPGGKYLVSGGLDKTVRLWDVAGSKELQCFRGHTRHVWAVAISANGRRILSGAHDGTVRLWDADTGKEVRCLTGHRGDSVVACVAVCGDGHHALSSSWDGTVRLWDLDKGKQSWVSDFKSPIVRFTISPDGSQLALGSTDGLIRLVELPTGRLIRSWKAHPSPIWAVSFLPDGRHLLSGGEDARILLWESDAGREIRLFRGHTGAVRDLQVATKADRFVSTSQDGTARLWSLDLNKPNASPEPDYRLRWEPEVQRLEAEAARQLMEGELVEALPKFEIALAVREKMYPPQDYPQGHPDLANSLGWLGVVLESRGDLAGAEPFYRDALAMRRKLYPEAQFPRGHPDLARSLNNLGHLLESRGDLAGAESFYREALAMCQRLYPAARFPLGQPHLTTSLNNLGSLLQEMGEHSKALPYLEQALAMNQRLHPAARLPLGHPELATSLNNQGFLLQTMGEHSKALPYLEQALARKQRLYPAARFPLGHPELATSLNNLGSLLQEMGEHSKALPYLEQALAMNQRLYPAARFPKGHPHLTESLGNLGFLLRDKGEHSKALPYLEQAMAMARRVSERSAAGAAEAQALNILRPLLLTRDGYLSAAVPGHVPGADCYDKVWASKALLTRLLERRHQATRIALSSSKPAQQQWQELLETRRHLARLLLESGTNRATRDKELARLTDRKESLERDLAALLPEIDRAKVLEKLSPTDLAGLLPKGAVFIDFLRYTHFGKGRQRTDKYLAFVVQPAQAVRLIELQDAQAIDEAVNVWRQAIARGEETPGQAACVGALVWQPLAKELPADLTTLYLAPDGALAWLPWAALPGKQSGRVLLDEVAVAIIPHGPFLLEQLKYPPQYAKEQERVVALGAVHYGLAKAGGYAPLPGTAAELKQVRALAGPRPTVTLEQDQATWAKLKELMPTARYVHLATHGFFDAPALRDERKRLEQQQKAWKFDRERFTPRVGFGTRSPLSYTGLALAGANDAKPGADPGIVTGEALVELPLEGLRLCVLSACESGLGDLGPLAGEGVQGLPRAFHLAGCPNVVSSLWNVNDKATAALMARFYHGLWHEGKTPLEALRQAQLTIYRHPERIADLADRSAPNFRVTIALPPDLATAAAAPGSQAKRAPTKLWAAFVLSGVGK